MAFATKGRQSYPDQDQAEQGTKTDSKGAAEEEQKSSLEETTDPSPQPLGVVAEPHITDNTEHRPGVKLY